VRWDKNINFYFGNTLIYCGERLFYEDDMSRLTVFAVLSILLASILGLSSAQSPASADPLFSNNGNLRVPDGAVLIEGDILMHESQLHTRGAYQMWSWPGGKVYYEFAPYISPENRALMREAMDELEAVAAVTFLPRIEEPNYIYIIEDGANYSYVGMVRGRQELSIYNWDYKYIMVHELMHALGIWHEQSRTDRDDYVTINFDNVYPGYEFNFDVMPGSLTYGPYDFCSLMHYDPEAFSLNGLPTIVAKPGYEAQAACMGNRTSMTAQDEATVAHLYDPSNDAPGDRMHTAFELPEVGHYTYTSPSTAFGVTSEEPVFHCASEGKAVTNTVWFEVTPYFNRYVEIYAGGYDTVIAVYTTGYTETDLFMEACSDSYGTGITEWIGLPLENGKRYFIGVGSWAGSTGLLEFEVYSYRNLLWDASFDWQMNVWKRAAVPSNRLDDKTKCNRSGSFYSLCALTLKGGPGENTSFKQVIVPDTSGSIFDWGFAAGDNLWLSYMIRSGSAKNRVMVKATITFEDGTKQKLVVPATVGSTNGYYLFEYASAELTRSDVDKIVVKVINKSTGGKTLVDNLTLTGDAGFNLRAGRPFAAPTKPQSFSPVVNQRRAQSSLLPVPPPAN
jgi:hypothetical protein